MTSTTKPMRAPQARARKTRQQILEAARKVILSKGFEGATTMDIARDAGVAEGSVFAHFGNKQGLLAGVMEGHYEDLIIHATGIAESQQDASTRLACLIDFHLTSLLSSWGLVRVFAHYGRYNDTDFSRSFQRVNRNYTRIFQSCLDDLKQTGKVDASLPADLLRDMIFGGAEHWAIRAKELDQSLNKADAISFLMGRVLAHHSDDSQRIDQLETRIETLAGNLRTPATKQVD